LAIAGGLHLSSERECCVDEWNHSSTPDTNVGQIHVRWQKMDYKAELK
jgi:hypothetical protein